MDTRKIDNANPAVLLDLLKVWISDAVGRHAVDTVPEHCGWASLATALRCAAKAAERRAALAAEVVYELDPSVAALSEGGLRSFQQLNERELRRRVAFTYQQQDDATLEEIARAKLQDRYSFFRLSSYASVEEVRNHWDWYLYCLTFEAQEVRQATEAGEEVASMPLDMVDLQVASSLFSVSITVSHLMEEAQRFSPPGFAIADHIHLVLHRGMWAPLVPGAEECSRLPPGAVVELGDLPPGVMVRASNRTAVVSEFDEKLEAYMATVDKLGVTFPVERDQIKSVVYHELLHHEADSKSTAADRRHRDRDRGQKKGDKERSNPVQNQLPAPDSLEWFVLHDLVSRIGRARLELEQQHLAGRTAAPGTTAPANGCGPAPGGHFAHTNGFHSSTASRLDQVPTAARNETTRQDTSAAANGALPEALAPQGGGARQPQAAPRAASGATAGTTAASREASAPTPAAAHAPADAPARPPADPVRRMELEELSERLKLKTPFWAIAPTEWRGDSSGVEGVGSLNVSLGDEVCLWAVSGDLQEGAWVLGATASAPSREGWFPSDCMMLWKVWRPWRPTAEDVAGHSERFLPLDENGVFHVSQRFDGEWKGWARGVDFGSTLEGMLPLSHLRPFMMLSRPS